MMQEEECNSYAYNEYNRYVVKEVVDVVSAKYLADFVVVWMHHVLHSRCRMVRPQHLVVH